MRKRPATVFRVRQHHLGRADVGVDFKRRILHPLALIVRMRSGPYPANGSAVVGRMLQILDVDIAVGVIADEVLGRVRIEGRRSYKVVERGEALRTAALDIPPAKIPALM